MPKDSKNALPMTADYFRLIVRHFGRSEALIAEIVRGTGVDPGSAAAAETDEPILLEQQLQQIRNISRIIGSHWALEIGAQFGTAAHGDLAVAAACAADLGTALRVIERFAYLRAPYFKIASTDTADEWILHIRPRLRLEPATWAPLVETLLLSIQSTIESALGRPIEEARFEMDFDAPPHIDRYASAFHAPATFGAEQTSICLPSDWRSLPCPYSNATTHRRAVEQLEVAERNFRDPKFLVGRIEICFEHSTDTIPTITAVARQLSLSRRTLARRLTEQGTSFRALTEKRRRKRSLELISDASLDISQIAERLGYTEPSNFGRAFRRWFNETPHAYRESWTRNEDPPHTGEV
jgi:AraC-like DNA-binding protein